MTEAVTKRRLPPRGSHGRFIKLPIFCSSDLSVEQLCLGQRGKRRMKRRNKIEAYDFRLAWYAGKAWTVIMPEERKAWEEV